MPRSRHSCESVGDGLHEGAHLLQRCREAPSVVVVEPGAEALFDDLVVVLELHDLGFVHLPELVGGQFAAGPLTRDSHWMLSVHTW